MTFSKYQQYLLKFIGAVEKWQQSFPEFVEDETLLPDPLKFEQISKEFLKRLEDNYPFHHPLYAGQMLKPPHPVAMLGYIAAMMINPNNHALDGGPATAQMEKEVVSLFAEKFGFEKHLGHLTSSGTIANLEALWVSREIYPGKFIIFSDEAHYTHERVCRLIKANYERVKSTSCGKIDLIDLKEKLDKIDVGTVIVTLGTTALGALDPLDEIFELQKKYNFRVHVDTAYGGYYKVISSSEKNLQLFDLISKADSLAFDPHKLGLQPYGCGCIIFKDNDVGRYYKHDSPYTYFTSDDLHLGEISFECSRPGAAAAALWLTTKCFELEADFGMGPILKKQRRAALRLVDLINKSKTYRLYMLPELDIVTYFPVGSSTIEISAKSDEIFSACMGRKETPLFLARLTVKTEKFQQLFPDVQINSKEITILRSCMLKPEHFDWADNIMKVLEEVV